MSKYERDILQIAKEMMRESHGTTYQKALRHAKDIYRNRGSYKVTSEEKPTNDERTPWEKLPEHIRENIKRQRKTKVEREKEGRVLPPVHFVSGGKVSPK
ncbi:MAG: hypothetical protein PHD39_00985 [Methylobacter tundripaludum]|nr:hypothetical protein [Methylobacter tundripaludum]